MKNKKTYITLTSMLVLGGVLAVSQQGEPTNATAADNGSYEVVVEGSTLAEEENVPTSVFGLYSSTGTIWDSSELEEEGVKFYNFTVGDDFVGGVQLNKELRPNFTYNMTYSLTRTDFDGKNKETLVEDRKYTENQDIQVAGKGEGIYKFVVQMYSDEDPEDIIVVNTTIFERDPIDFSVKLDAKDPDTAVIENADKDIESILYKVITKDGEILNSGQVEGAKLPKGLVTGLDKGDYTLEVEATSKPYGLTEGITETLTSSEFLEFEVSKSPDLEPKATISKSTEVNPLDIIGTQKLEDSELSWVVKDSKDKEIASEKTNQVYIDTLAKLSKGTYTASFTEKATDGTESTVETEFKIVKPQVKLSIEEVDPESIVAVASGVEGNAIDWKIVQGETQVAVGETLTVSNDILIDLEKGDYTVKYTESDVYGNIGEVEVDFKVSEKGNAGVVEGTNNGGVVVEEEMGVELPDNSPEEPKDVPLPEEEVIDPDDDGTLPDPNEGKTDEEVTDPDENETEPDGEDTTPDKEGTEPKGENNTDEDGPTTLPNGDNSSGTVTNPSDDQEKLNFEDTKHNGKNTPSGNNTHENSDTQLDIEDTADIISEDRRVLKPVEIAALHWGKDVDKTVMAPTLMELYGYANIEKGKSDLYLESWASEKDGLAAETSKDKYLDTEKYSDGTWRNNNIIEGVNFGENLDSLVAKYLASPEGKEYLETPEGKESYDNYAKSLQQTDKSTVMTNLGFLLTAVGLGFVAVYFIDKKKKSKGKTEITTEPLVETPSETETSTEDTVTEEPKEEIIDEPLDK